ncbi:uncharacterized protein LOC143904734 isoform X1 [Temnothorax americanus]|uniref:uncharacterized protein LOC143904734 isoform X1 n=1 Tax=Temnothorax americanus TaxID=1964332 RepID=UPI00406984D5
MPGPLKLMHFGTHSKRVQRSNYSCTVTDRETATLSPAVFWRTYFDTTTTMQEIQIPNILKLPKSSSSVIKPVKKAGKSSYQYCPLRRVYQKLPKDLQNQKYKEHKTDISN